MPGFAVAIWPNWVDLIVIICVARGCYSGFAHGLVTEILTGIGAVAVTVLTVSSWSVVLGWLTHWLPRLPLPILAPAVFWGVFLIVLVGMRILLRALVRLVKWERLHWLIQGSGLVLGGVRGLWWAGLIVLAFTTSGFAYLASSVQERSVLGPRLVRIFHAALETVVDRLPGAQERKSSAIPPVNTMPHAPDS